MFVEKIPNWKVEKHANVFLVKQLDPYSKTYIAKYVISKKQNEFRLFDTSSGTVVYVSELFGTVIVKLLNYINSQSDTPNPPNPLPLNSPSMLKFPEISEASNILTKEEINYIDAIVKSYGLETSSGNEYYVSIVYPITPNSSGGVQYVVNKEQGYYRIFKNVDNIVIYSSPGFYSLIEKLKKIFDFGDDSSQGGPPPPPPPTPEYPTTGNHALVGELIQTIANKTELPPEEVKKQTDFGNTSKGFAKIAAIKALREFYVQQGMNTALHFSKLAIEHWQDFLAYVIDNGLPEQTYDNFNNKILNYRSKKTTTKTLTNNDIADQLIQTISQMTGFPVDDVAAGKFPPSQKIQVIKAIRTYYSNSGKSNTILGAKLSIEHWADFIAYVRDNGLPDMGIAKYDKASDSNYSKKPDTSYIGYNSKKKTYNNNSAVLTDDEKEWITTFFANNYPYLEVDLAPDGMVYINQPDPDVIKEITKGYKPLFIIYKSSPTTYVFRKVAGGKGMVFSFSEFFSFSELVHFVTTNIGAFVPPAPKTPQVIEWENVITYNYNGNNLRGTACDKKLIHNGFSWSELNNAYVNHNLHQLVIIYPATGINIFKILWVTESGNAQMMQTPDILAVFSAIGPRGTIVKNEQKIKAGQIEANPYNNPSTPSPAQQDLLNKLGFVKQSSEKVNGVISYSKPSEESGNAYYILDINLYTGETGYAEVDEEGTSEGYSYPSLGNALTFLKNKFADELNDSDEENSMNSLENEVENVTDTLAKLGFIYKENDGKIYEYATSDGKHYIAFNVDNGKLMYGIGITYEPDSYDIVKSFYDVDDFVQYYLSENEADSKFSVLEKYGFQKENSQNTSILTWKRPSSLDDDTEHYVVFYKSNKNVKYEVINVENNDNIISKSFENIDEALEYLKYKFEFNPPKEVPYSGANYQLSFTGMSPYQTMRLNTFDEATLFDMGFEYYPQLFIGNTKMGDPVYNQGYRTIKGKRLFVYGDGAAVYQSSDNDPGMKFETIKAALQYLWEGMDWSGHSELAKNTIKWKLSAKPEPITHSGQMPYSGHDYSLLSTLFNNPPNKATVLAPQDSETMHSMGFESQAVNTTDPAFKIVYKKGNEEMYFFSDGRAAYWTGKTGPQQYFNTVKDAMQFLWNKHTPYIEEVASYKTFMKNWLE